MTSPASPLKVILINGGAASATPAVIGGLARDSQAKVILSILPVPLFCYSPFPRKAFAPCLTDKSIHRYTPSMSTDDSTPSLA